MLRRIQLDREYRSRWISYAMQDRFGVWVEFREEALGDGIEPDEAVLSFVAEKLEQFRQRRAEERENTPLQPLASLAVHLLHNGVPACNTPLTPRVKRNTLADRMRVTCERCRSTAAFRCAVRPEPPAPPPRPAAPPAACGHLRLVVSNPALCLEERPTRH